MLDAVMGGVEELKLQVGQADKVRLEQHLDGIRALEKQLAFLEAEPPNLEACLKPEAPATDWPTVAGVPPILEKAQAVNKILAMALACDQTRIFSNYFTSPLTDMLFPGATMGHHQLTHDEPGEQDQVNAITKVCMQAFADQVATLREVQEGAGTLLDRCVVLDTSDVSLGKTHALDEYPILLAGGGCGTLRTGYHSRSDTAENASKVMVSIGRAMGLGWNEYGEGDAHASEGLGEIEL